MRYGTYGRKTPDPMRVARFDCHDCQTTISRLPDFAAARRRGSLQEIENDMIVLATLPDHGRVELTGLRETRGGD